MSERPGRRKAVPKRWIRGPSDVAAVAQGCYFDEEKGRIYIDLIQAHCRQSRDEWRGQPLDLVDWQVDLIMRLFGWRRADGRRRFTTCYVEIPKKNGKSTLVSALVTAFVVLEGGAPEIYLNAVDREQASIVFDEAANMVRASPALRKRLEVVDSRKRILNRKNGGSIRANSADVANKDGINASLVVFDELHRFGNDRGLWDIMKYAGASRSEPLRLVITTAGEDESGPWFEQRTLSHAVNNGTRDEIDHLGIVYAVEESDDLDDPKTWHKVNPSLGKTIRLDSFAKDYRQAKEDGPVEWAKFCRLRLGLIVKSSAAFISLELWDRCSAPAVIKPRLPIYVGLDLSECDDLTAMAWVQGDDKRGVDLRLKYWLPEDDISRLEKESGIAYRVYEREGLIDLIPGPVVDYDWIRDAILKLDRDHEIASILCDPHMAHKLCFELKDKHGLPVEFLRQGFLSLSAPTKEFYRLVKATKIRHGGNAILRRNIGNAIVETDAAGNIKISKRRSRGKIDGAAAAINAIAGITSGSEFDGESIYDKRGILTL